jgi:hypothetical protein
VGIVMTSITVASLPEAADSRGLFHEIRKFWREFSGSVFNPYRPELHYMRGPGPAWQAKHAGASIAGSDRIQH